MEVIHYETENNEYYINSIVMIPNKENDMNGFYKIIKFSDHFFHLRKMKCETRMCKMNDNTKTKVYEAIISTEFEEDNHCKKIRKTSINQKYPIILCSVVQYEV